MQLDAATAICRSGARCLIRWQPGPPARSGTDRLPPVGHGKHGSYQFACQPVNPALPPEADPGGNGHPHARPRHAGSSPRDTDRIDPARSRATARPLIDPRCGPHPLLPSLTLKREMEREKHVVDVGAVDMGISGVTPGRTGKTGSDGLGRSCPQLHSGLGAAFVRSDVLPNRLSAVHPPSPVLPTLIPRKPAVVRRVVHTSTGLSTPSVELSTRYPRRSWP